MELGGHSLSSCMEAAQVRRVALLASFALCKLFNVRIVLPQRFRFRLPYSNSSHDILTSMAGPTTFCV